MLVFWAVVIILNVIFGLGNAFMWMSGDGAYHLFFTVVNVLAVVLGLHVLGILEEK